MINPLLKTLQEIKGDQKAGKDARWAIGRALLETAGRMKAPERPKILDPLLNALQEIEGENEAANSARWHVVETLTSTLI
jgi:hypothetical protein